MGAKILAKSPGARARAIARARRKEHRSLAPSARPSGRPARDHPRTRAACQLQRARRVVAPRHALPKQKRNHPLPTMLVRMLRTMWRALSALAALLVIGVVVVQTSTHRRLYRAALGDEPAPTFAKPDIAGLFQLRPSHQFWRAAFEVMNANRPDVGDPAKAIAYTSAPKDGVFTKAHLLAKADILPRVVDELKAKHAQVLKLLPELKPNVVYKPDTSGIVFVGGGRFLWLAYLLVLLLRDTGLKLPVEVVMPTYKDYEEEVEFCTLVLPQHDASCVVVPDVLGPLVMLTWSKKLASYQFKSLALMVLLFQNVLLVDADNMLLKLPDALFASEVFERHGMVTWPDYWRRVILPVFYDIAGVGVDEALRTRVNRLPLDPPVAVGEEEAPHVPYHDLDGAIPDLLTELGQLLINKATHSKTLLLLMYYNMYGPNLYYRLLSLGDQGEGDKDTFPAAAHVARQPFYQVKSFIKTFGYVGDDGGFKGVAMGQKDAIVDYALYQKKIGEVPQGLVQDRIKYLQDTINLAFGENGEVDLFTIHCNYPKLDPVILMEQGGLYDKDKKVLKHRMYGGIKVARKAVREGRLVDIEEDFELLQWKNMKLAICDRKYVFPHLAGKNRDDICTFIANQVHKLSE